jgi:SM-20-related protein
VPEPGHKAGRSVKEGVRVIKLNPALDIGALAQTYAAKRRMQVRDFFEEESAERIHRMLVEETPWWVAFNEGNQVHQLPPEEARRLGPQQIQQLMAGIQQRAQTQYQFLYEYYPLFSKYFTPGAGRLPIFEVYEFINSEPVLDFLRRLTGRPGIRWADGHATLYRSGHFLKYHTDEKPEDSRAAAYVFNFTKNWGRDWGGFLQFWNARYDVEEAYRPVFNALNIFTVPMEHSVGQVASYAPGHRFSITGWLREDEPPGPIGGR